MARLPRVVVIDVPHHVTQRGNARQVILATDADRITYLDLLQEYTKLYGLGLLGYCLMSNHVHLIAVPHALDALSQSLKQAHGRYASYWNARQSSSWHVWQGRFYSCPLEEEHLWIALRYVELNPVRAGMVERAEEWRWSSAGAHCGLVSPDPTPEMERWRKRWAVADWVEFLAEEESPEEVSALRHSTHTGRPFLPHSFAKGANEWATRPKLLRNVKGRGQECPRYTRWSKATSKTADRNVRVTQDGARSLDCVQLRLTSLEMTKYW